MAGSAELGPVNTKVECILTIFSLCKFNSDQRGITFTNSLKDNPGSPDVSLTPQFLFSVEELKSLNATVEHVEPAGVENIIPFFFAVVKENVERLFKVDQMESYRVSTALLVS